MMWCVRAIFVLYLIIIGSGCQQTAEIARSGGKTIGEVLSVPTAATEGVAQGYGQVGAEENPYNR